MILELTKQFSDQQFARALESWGWLDLAGKTPRFTSLFGHIFFEAADGAWWFLDPFEGQLERTWNNGAELAAQLETEEGQDEYLLGGLALAAYHRRGLRLNADQVYAWAPPPIITRSFAVDDIAVFDFVVVSQIGGQIHDQLRTKPPGWTINRFAVTDDGGIRLE